MNQQEKKQILRDAQEWFTTSIAANHIKNTRKLVDPSKLTINPFTVVYLANFLTGRSDAIGIAKALVYPRVLGSSISTSFGTGMQNFVSNVLSAYGSTTSGIDIEFIDALDGHKKFCQLKAGPNTINKDDVETIHSHFAAIQRLSTTNNVRVTSSDLIVGVIYGDESQLNANYKSLEHKHYHTVTIGTNFWHRLTGDDSFYLDIIRDINVVAVNADFTDELENIIAELATKPEILALVR